MYCGGLVALSMLGAGEGMLSKILLVLATVMAFFAPQLFSGAMTGDITESTFPGWPQEYEGKQLTQLSLSKKEEYFLRDFPGKIARFQDGQREFVIRWVEQPTRKLHPARDCFKGIGYTIKPLDLKENQQGKKMSCFSATKKSTNLQVCEYIESTLGTSWSDVSAWYWGTVFGSSARGWMSYVIAEGLESDEGRAIDFK